MNMCRMHSAWAIAGLLVTFTVASPVWADDVELLLSTPAASDAAKPNILFIIDSSGSMTTVEKSQEPYNGNKTYSGPCRQDMYYWSTNNSIPNCGSNYRFYKSVFPVRTGQGSGTRRRFLHRYNGDVLQVRRPREVV